MKFFKKKEKKEILELPELPKLPEFSGIEEINESEESREEQIPLLPSFPNGSLGNKFSQDTIKEAVTGEKWVKEVKTDEFAKEKMQMMRKPLIKEETEKEFYPKFERIKTKEAEPIFIRIDKFEDGSRTFEEVKKQISEIEDMFEDLKKIKEKEEKELEFWEEEIKKIKEKLEKIDSNIFSKTE